MCFTCGSAEKGRHTMGEEHTFWRLRAIHFAVCPNKSYREEWICSTFLTFIQEFNNSFIKRSLKIHERKIIYWYTILTIFLWFQYRKQRHWTLIDSVIIRLFSLTTQLFLTQLLGCTFKSCYQLDIWLSVFWIQFAWNKQTKRCTEGEEVEKVIH